MGCGKRRSNRDIIHSIITYIISACLPLEMMKQVPKIVLPLLHLVLMVDWLQQYVYNLLQKLQSYQGSLDRIVRLWDAQTGYFLERYEGHLDSVYSVAFSPDGTFRYIPFLTLILTSCRKIDGFWISRQDFKIMGFRISVAIKMSFYIQWS